MIVKTGCGTDGALHSTRYYSLSPHRSGATPLNHSQCSLMPASCFQCQNVAVVNLNLCLSKKFQLENLEINLGNLNISVGDRIGMVAFI